MQQGLKPRRHPSFTHHAYLCLALLACLSLLLGACNRPESDAANEAPSSDPSPAAITESPAEATTVDPSPANTEQADPGTLLPNAPAAAGGTIPPLSATLVPLEETILRLFADSLDGTNPAASPEEGYPLLRADVRPWLPATWLVHTVGLRDFSEDQSHRVNIYQQLSEHVVAEVARMNLDSRIFGPDTVGEPDFLGEGSAHQVQLDPNLLFFALEGGVGAHGGVYDLLKFDPSDNSLEVVYFASNDSPGVATEADLDGDGFVEILVNATDPYVFCYACGVRFPGVTLWRWDGQEVVQTTLGALEPDAPPEAVAADAELRALAEAGLWKDVIEALPAAEEQIATLGANPDGQLAWNLRLLRLIAEAKRAPALDNESPYPLLANLFYGDYDAALAVMKNVSPQALLASPSALVTGTVAMGWEETLASWIERTTAPAVAFAADLAPAWFIRGWGDWLIGDLDDARAWLNQAAALAPDDPYMTEVAALVGESPAEGDAHIVALTPVEVRSGPGNSFSIVATLQPGQSRTVTGKFGVAPDLWWQLESETGEVAWVFADTARLEALNVDRVPTVVAPAQMAPVALQGRVFFSVDEDGMASIFEIGVGVSSPPTLIIEQARQPALHLDSGVLAFSSQRPDMLGLGGIDLATGERFRYTYNLEDALPRWNRSGDRILFSSTREGDRRPRIYRIEVLHTIAADTIRLGLDADWSAIDGRIVFKGCDGTGNACGLWLMDGDGANASALTNNPSDSRPRWAPDGASVLFMSDGRDGNWEIYRLQLSSGAVTRITSDTGEDGLPVFSPDGESIAWVARRDGRWGIWVQALIEGRSMLIHTFGDDYPNWLEQGLDWAP